MTNAKTFTTTAYGQKLSGTFDTFGWTPDEQTKLTLDAMETSKRHRASLRCVRAASKAHSDQFAR